MSLPPKILYSKSFFIDFSHGLAGFVKIHNKFFKERGVELDFNARKRPNFFGCILGILHDGLTDFLHAFGTHQGQINT